jgi:hypothetical protein
MLPGFLLAITLLAVACIPVKPITFAIKEDFGEKLHRKRTLLCCLLFLISILIVFRVIPFLVGLIIIPLILFFADKESLLMVDYPLLGTFFFFFIFAGNMARIDQVNQLFSTLLTKDTLLVSILSCQFISNVPSAILLSQFTTDYPALLLGVNIGGAGTLIASLASLITFREYCAHNPGKAGSYLAKFTALNFGFAGVLTLLASFLV